MAIIPQLVIGDGRAAEAIDFYKALFGAREERRVPGEGGKLMHSELFFAGGVVHVNDDFGPSTAPAMVALFIGLDKAAEVDAVIAKAKAAGATVIQEAQDMFWGDRFGMFRDPFGHRWHVGAPQG
jgi:PhnB protein